MPRTAKQKPRAERGKPATERRRAARRVDTGQRLLAPRLVLLFLAGCLLFATPALWPTGHSAMTRIGGVPVLYVALFAAWALYIGVLGWLAESSVRPPARDAAPETHMASDDVGDLLP
jgi:Zn-dependent protease